ncbi:DUF3644 domain-containing protein [Pontibacter sp. FD36]|uniref:DUF3644 domain-containing protein n=1 Tax=Pontibacter sp. FD36 TaxID=2789860 RepID=UPI0018A9B8F8|nr:DUF3644 domain-containing protein [Pontibacter sp. FD36]MBF8962151.1 DUF3644 domain-containing protein [Pontibacter sp. FD36]
MKPKKIWSFKEELLIKSREAMLCAVQIFNNPNMKFKSESFIVLSNIAWMYLLHAYYKEKKVEYRYHKVVNGKRRFDRTKKGAYKCWELERCLDDDACPIDPIAKSNLKFLIGLRHEIEHQMSRRIDDYLSARFQACCLNYNTHIKNLFAESYGIDKYLSFSLQFSTINEDHATQLRQFSDLPKNIASYINAFDESLSDEEYNDIRFSYRVLYVPKLVNHKGQADKVIEFIKADSPEAESLNKEYVVIKERERKKYLPAEVWSLMQSKGFPKFGQHQHTMLWKELDAKASGKNYGSMVAKHWYWYDTWLEEVERHCNSEGDRYKRV